MPIQESKNLALPTWRDRLKACFSLQHRFLHVFGVPAILGLLTASLDLGGAEGSLGLLVGGGLAAAGAYLVTVGADRRLNRRLFEEKRERALDRVEAQFHEIRARVGEETREALQRIEVLFREIRAIFEKGEKDEITAVLATAEGDVNELRRKAYDLAELDLRLGRLLGEFDGDRLDDEISRHLRTIKKAHNEAEEKAARAALGALERKKAQMDDARARLSQVRSALSTIESNLSEFKVGVELRKADALMRQGDVEGLEDLGLRLKATGSACDEILGSPKESSAREDALMERLRRAQAERQRG